MNDPEDWLADYSPEHGWQDDPITDRQLAALIANDFDPGLCEDLTKGQASHILDAVM